MIQPGDEITDSDAGAEGARQDTGGAAADGDGGGSDGPAIGVALAERMRLATREAHSAADAAVNLRLAGALADRERWGRAVSIFYVVFEKFESLIAAASREEGGKALRGVAGILEGGAARAPGFEADLLYFLGERWRERVEGFKTPGVRAYVDHLERLARERPALLVPYAYHLHMGMLSGGQILRNTAKRTMCLPKSGEGTRMFALVYRGEREGAVSRVKRDYRAAIDAVGEAMDKAQLEAFLEESVSCFRMNNAIVAELPWGASVWDMYRVLPSSYQGYVKAATVAALAVAGAVVATALLKNRR